MSDLSPVASPDKPLLMIIEDSADYRILLKRLFSKAGYEVSLATNGADALSQLEVVEKIPDVVLLDLMMPIMDGFEFREKQVQDQRIAGIPVILMTAHGDLKKDPEKLGIADFVRKPVDMDTLLTKVQALVKKI